MTVDPAAFKNILLVLTGFAAAFTAALWLSLLIWTYRDIHQRARDPLRAHPGRSGRSNSFLTWFSHLFYLTPWPDF